MAARPKKKARAGYMISAVAELYKIHPQTLRLYERVGLLKPSRSQGNTRLYTDSDLERLEVILTLTREMGVNLAGIEIILNMRENMLAEATPCIYAVREVSTGQRSIHTQFGLRMASGAPILSPWRWRIVRTAAALAGRSSSATPHGRKCARGLGPKPMLRACQMWTFSIWRRALPYPQRNHKALVRG